MTKIIRNDKINIKKSDNFKINKVKLKKIINSSNFILILF